MLDDTKICPFCAETIKRAAIKCRFCHSMLESTAPQSTSWQGADVASLPESSTSPVVETEGQQPFSRWVFEQSLLMGYTDIHAEFRRTDSIAVHSAERLASSQGFAFYGTVRGHDGVESDSYSIQLIVSTPDLGGRSVDMGAIMTASVTAHLGPISGGQLKRFCVVVPDSLMAPRPVLDPGEECWVSAIAANSDLVDGDPAPPDPNPGLLGMMWLAGGPDLPGHPIASEADTNSEVLASPLRFLRAESEASSSIRTAVVGGPSTSAHRADPEPAVEPSDSTWPHLQTSIPLLEWKGVKRMTRAATVACLCRSCGHQWDMDGAVANTLADDQGLANRLIRSGKGMEQFGATFARGSSGRRIAAGNEIERHDERLRRTYLLASCPACESIDILLAPP